MSKRSGGIAAAESATGAFCEWRSELFRTPPPETSTGAFFEWRGELYCPPFCLLFYFFSHTFG